MVIPSHSIEVLKKILEEDNLKIINFLYSNSIATIEELKNNLKDIAEIDSKIAELFNTGIVRYYGSNHIGLCINVESIIYLADNIKCSR